MAWSALSCNRAAYLKEAAEDAAKWADDTLVYGRTVAGAGANYAEQYGRYKVDDVNGVIAT